jgi:hypothetical protein
MNCIIIIMKLIELNLYFIIIIIIIIITVMGLDDYMYLV